VLQLVAVHEVMTPADAANATVRADVPVSILRERFAAESLHGAVVVAADGSLVGVVARSDLGAEDADRPGATAADVATRRPATALPDEPVFRAVQRMANLDVGRLPVIDPGSGRVVGVFRRADVVRAYDRGIERTVSDRLARDAGRLRDVTGLGTVRLVIAPGSAVAGATVRDVQWPERTILTGVQRGTTAIVPGGDTVLTEDDVVVAITADPDALRGLLSRPRAAAPGPGATGPEASEAEEEA
jgi:CIC family chloride channel protein